MLEKYPDLLTMTELEEIMHTRRYTALRLIRTELEAFKEGGKWLITKESVIDYIRDRIADQ